MESDDLGTEADPKYELIVGMPVPAKFVPGIYGIYVCGSNPGMMGNPLVGMAVPVRAGWGNAVPYRAAVARRYRSSSGLKISPVPE